MALIDVISMQMNNGLLVAKYPSEDLRLGTQLVVYPGQMAFFIKGGKVFDAFTSGTYTLKTENIPFLNKIINLPFGGNSPFRAEVWFVNQMAIMATKWGTATPLQIEDPKYEVIVPLRAYGQYNFRISNPGVFLDNLVGNQKSLSTDTIREYFKGKVMSQLTNIISDKLTKDGISILNINSHLSDISNYCCEKISDRFDSYGLKVNEFDIISINPKEDDESFKKLKDAKDLAARLKITGRDVYQMQRSFDVMNNAAENSGVAGAVMGAGVGLGMGVGAGAQIGQVSSFLNTNPAPAPPDSPEVTPPPIPPQKVLYYLAIGGQQYGPYNYDNISTWIRNKQIDLNALVWHEGMAGWDNLLSQPEFASLKGIVPPPIFSDTSPSSPSHQ